MSDDKILRIELNSTQVASCSACGEACYVADHRRPGPECITWSKPSMLHNLVVGRGTHATIIRFCDGCLLDLGAKIQVTVAFNGVNS